MTNKENISAFLCIAAMFTVYIASCLFWEYQSKSMVIGGLLGVLTSIPMAIILINMEE